MHEDLARALCAEIALRAWDDPPGVYCVTGGGGAMTARAIPADIPWGAAPPPLLLHALAGGLDGWAGEWLRSVTPPDYQGAAFFCPTWTQANAAPGTAERSEQAAAVMSRQVSEHPGSTQALTMWGVLTNGDAVVVMGGQGRGPVRAVSGGPDTRVILDALAIIAEASTGTAIGKVTLR